MISDLQGKSVLVDLEMIEDKKVQRVAETKFNKQEYQEQFFQKNKSNLKSRFKQIFSPNTVEKNKTEIFKAFQEIYGKLDRKKLSFVTMEQNFESYKLKTNLKNKVTESTKSLLLYWLRRVQRLIEIKKQVARLLEKHTNIQCDYCGSNWGLRNENIQNIEEVYCAFQKQAPEETHQINDW